MTMVQTTADDATSVDSLGKRKTLRRVMIRFAKKTSLIGVAYINSAKLMVAKTIWVILLLGSIGVMTFHLYYLCDQFFSWPRSTTVMFGFNNLELPAVTICNVNTVQRKYLTYMSDPYRNLINSLNPHTIDQQPYTQGDTDSKPPTPGGTDRDPPPPGGTGMGPPPPGGTGMGPPPPGGTGMDPPPPGGTGMGPPPPGGTGRVSFSYRCYQPNYKEYKAEIDPSSVSLRYLVY